MGCNLRTPLLHLLSFDNPLTPILYVTLKLKKVLFIHVYNYIVSSTLIVTQKSWLTGTQLWGIWTLTSGKSGTIQVNSGPTAVLLEKMKDLGRQIAANKETADFAQTACANGKSHLGTVEVSAWKKNNGRNYVLQLCFNVLKQWSFPQQISVEYVAAHTSEANFQRQLWVSQMKIHYEARIYFMEKTWIVLLA